MDAAILTILGSLHTREDVLNLLVRDMKAKDPVVFASFVNFVRKNIGAWENALRVIQPTSRDVPVIQHYTPIMGSDGPDALFELFRGKKVLMTATQSPGRGGSATNCYKLTRYLREECGIPTACIFFQSLDYDYVDKYDPDQIGGVWRAPRFNSLIKSKSQSVRVMTKRNLKSIKKAVHKYLGGDPGVILCKNYAAPVESRFLYPKTPIVYLVSGSWHATQLRLTARDLLNMKHTELADMMPTEVQAIESSDAVVPNSSISAAVLSHIYQRFTHKICAPVDTSNIVPIRLTTTFPVDGWHDRPYDLAFISSSLDRAIKGPDIADCIMSHAGSAAWTKLVVGERSALPKFQSVQRCTTRPRQTHMDLMSLLTQVKVVLLTSRFDASPNIMMEALQHGAYPLCSENIGNSERLDKALIVRSLHDTDEWVATAAEVFKHPPVCPIVATDDTPLSWSLLGCMKEKLFV